jgi:hypothetical protein
LKAGELLLNIKIKKRGFIAADETIIFIIKSSGRGNF